MRKGQLVSWMQEYSWGKERVYGYFQHLYESGTEAAVIYRSKNPNNGIEIAVSVAELTPVLPRRYTRRYGQ